MAVKFNNICRLCMVGSADKLLPIFHMEGNLPGKLTALVPSIKMCAGDGLPEQVCSTCVHQVITSYNFKLQCENVDVQLRTLLACQDTDSNNQMPERNSENGNSLLTEVKVEENTDPEISLEHDVDNDFKNEERFSEDEAIDSTCMSDTVLIEDKEREIIPQRIKKQKRLKDKNTRNFICDVCGKAFKQRHHLQDHYVTHTGERPFDCDVCGKNFALKHCLKIHLRIHTGEKPYCCEECGSCFSQNSALHSHMSSHTQIIKRYECVHCGHKFSRNNHLQSHLVRHTGERSFPCNICGKEFGRKDTLKKHIDLHSGKKPHICKTCGKCFARNQQLKDHVATHEEKKPYICLECGKTFANNSRLREHMPQHTGKRPFPCPHCVKRFVRREHLKYHLNAVHGKQETFS